MLKAAGYELRLHLEPYDDHDDVLAALEQQRSEVDRERWDTYQTARVTRDRATTAAALRPKPGGTLTETGEVFDRWPQWTPSTATRLTTS